MSDLPDGWEWALVDDVTVVQGGIQKQPKRRPVDNAFPFLRVANVLQGRLDLTEVHEVELFEGELDRYALVDGDLLVVEGNGSPGHIGRAARWRTEIPDAVHQNHLIRIRPIPGVLDAKYLEFLWNSAQVNEQLRAMAGSTSGLLTLSVSKLKRIRLPLPPLAEQRRIVAALEDHLSRLDNSVHLVRSTLERLDRFRDQVLLAAASGSLDERLDGKSAAPPAPVGVNDGELPNIPATWVWRRLGDFAEVVGGVAKDAKKQSDPSLPEVPYLRVANVQRGQLDLDDVMKIRVDPVKAKKLHLEYGDVLLNEGGDRDKLGRGWIWEGQIDRCIHQNHVFRARIVGHVIHPKLLAWHANGFGKEWFFANGKQSVNLASISLSKVKMLPVPVPPREEQERLVEAAEQYLSTFDKTEHLLASVVNRAHHLRRGLLREAFTGRLVEQDPVDEPISVLLEQIRTEREKATKVQRKRNPRAAKAKPEALWKGAQGALDLEL